MWWRGSHYLQFQSSVGLWKSSSSTVWFSFSPAKYKYCEHTVFYPYAVLQYTRQIDLVPVLLPESCNDAAAVKRLRFGWTLWSSLPHQTMVETWSTTVSPISLEMTVLFFLLLLLLVLLLFLVHVLLLWLLPLSSCGCLSPLFTKQNRGSGTLCCSPGCKLLNRLECVEIWLFVCCRLILWDFSWEVWATNERVCGVMTTRWCAIDIRA